MKAFSSIQVQIHQLRRTPLTINTNKLLDDLENWVDSWERKLWKELGINSDRHKYFSYDASDHYVLEKVTKGQVSSELLNRLAGDGNDDENPPDDNTGGSGDGGGGMIPMEAVMAPATRNLATRINSLKL